MNLSQPINTKPITRGIDTLLIVPLVTLIAAGLVAFFEGISTLADPAPYMFIILVPSILSIAVAIFCLLYVIMFAKKRRIFSFVRVIAIIFSLVLVAVTIYALQSNNLACSSSPSCIVFAYALLYTVLLNPIFIFVTGSLAILGIIFEIKSLRSTLPQNVQPRSK